MNSKECIYVEGPTSKAKERGGEKRMASKRRWLRKRDATRKGGENVRTFNGACSIVITSRSK